MLQLGEVRPPATRPGAEFAILYGRLRHHGESAAANLRQPYKGSFDATFYGRVRQTTSQGVFSLSTTAQRNLAAAQWSPNGGQLGSPDLTAPANQVFGLNVFGPPAQGTHLPKSVYARLKRTLDQGEPLDLELADGVASAMRSWAME